MLSVESYWMFRTDWSRCSTRCSTWASLPWLTGGGTRLSPHQPWSPSPTGSPHTPTPPPPPIPSPAPGTVAPPRHPPARVGLQDLPEEDNFISDVLYPPPTPTQAPPPPPGTPAPPRHPPPRVRFQDLQEGNLNVDWVSYTTVESTKEDCKGEN